MKKLKKPVRRVRVEFGGRIPYKLICKVIDSRSLRSFGGFGVREEELLVEKPDRERVWVEFWEDVPEKREKKKRK